MSAYKAFILRYPPEHDFFAIHLSSERWICMFFVLAYSHILFHSHSFTHIFVAPKCRSTVDQSQVRRHGRNIARWWQRCQWKRQSISYLIWFIYSEKNNRIRTWNILFKHLFLVESCHPVVIKVISAFLKYFRCVFLRLFECVISQFKPFKFYVDIFTALFFLFRFRGNVRVCVECKRRMFNIGKIGERRKFLDGGAKALNSECRTAWF